MAAFGSAHPRAAHAGRPIRRHQARQAMIGIENRTLIQTRDGVKGFTFAQAQQNLCKIDKPYENPATQSNRATGDLLGSRWDNTKYPRTEAKRAYRAVLGRAEKTETGDRGGQYDQRTGGESEGVRYSVTDEPAPETGGAGSESQPAGSVAGDIRRGVGGRFGPQSICSITRISVMLVKHQ